MKINTALILCAGLGKRLNPLTLEKPKPLLKIKNLTMLERCIDMIIKLGFKKILLNTFHLKEQIDLFLKNKNFPIEVDIIEDGEEILNTGGGILNMINKSIEDNFFVFNPDTLWSDKYLQEINEMKNFYFLNKLSNSLLVTNKRLSFDKDLIGDFELKNHFLQKNNNKNFIFIGCQILEKKLFKDYTIKNFSIVEIWDTLLKKNELNGYESLNKFYHVTNLKIFNKLKDL
mgnify:CR=1 FL=1